MRSILAVSIGLSAAASAQDDSYLVLQCGTLIRKTVDTTFDADWVNPVPRPTTFGER